MFRAGTIQDHLHWWDSWKRTSGKENRAGPQMDTTAKDLETCFHEQAALKETFWREESNHTVVWWDLMWARYAAVRGTQGVFTRTGPCLASSALRDAPHIQATTWKAPLREVTQGRLHLGSAMRCQTPQCCSFRQEIFWTFPSTVFLFPRKGIQYFTNPPSVISGSSHAHWGLSQSPCLTCETNRAFECASHPLKAVLNQVTQELCRRVKHLVTQLALMIDAFLCKVQMIQLVSDTAH